MREKGEKIKEKERKDVKNMGERRKDKDGKIWRKKGRDENNEGKEDKYMRKIWMKERIKMGKYL